MNHDETVGVGGCCLEHLRSISPARFLFVFLIVVILGAVLLLVLSFYLVLKSWLLL